MGASLNRVERPQVIVQTQKSWPACLWCVPWLIRGWWCRINVKRRSGSRARVSDSSTPFAERASKDGRLAIESVKYWAGPTYDSTIRISIERKRNFKTAFPGDGCPLAGRERSLVKSASLLLNDQLLEHASKFRHIFTQGFEPRCRIPDLDANPSTDDHDVSTCRDVEELAKAFWNKNSRTVGDLHFSRPRRKQTAHALNITPTLLHRSRLNLAANHTNTSVQPSTPFVSLPETQTSVAFLRNDGLPEFVGHCLSHLGRKCDAKTIVNRALHFALDERFRCRHFDPQVQTAPHQFRREAIYLIGLTTHFQSN